MKERPILMSAPMVRAILAGTKSQTRRVCKPQPSRVDGGVPFGDGPAWAHAEPGSALIRCPYGVRGDRLWVREAWSRDCDHHWVMYRADLSAQRRAGGEVFDGCAAEELNPNARWRPSIHMRRQDSRITLEVTGVRVERLQDISEADAIAEGIQHLPRLEGYGLPDGSHFHVTDPRISYWSLWDAINGQGAVESNPFVWVVEFKRIEEARAK